MPFMIHPYRRVPVHCSVMYDAARLQAPGTLWNLSCTGRRLSGDWPMRPDEALSLTVTLSNEQQIKTPNSVDRWLSELECAVENTVIKRHTEAGLQYDVRRWVQESAEIVL